MPGWMTIGTADNDLTELEFYGVTVQIRPNKYKTENKHPDYVAMLYGKPVGCFWWRENKNGEDYLWGNANNHPMSLFKNQKGPGWNACTSPDMIEKFNDYKVRKAIAKEQPFQALEKKLAELNPKPKPDWKARIQAIQGKLS